MIWRIRFDKWSIKEKQKHMKKQHQKIKVLQWTLFYSGFFLKQKRIQGNTKKKTKTNGENWRLEKQYMQMPLVAIGLFHHQVKSSSTSSSTFSPPTLISFSIKLFSVHPNCPLDCFFLISSSIWLQDSFLF